MAELYIPALDPDDDEQPFPPLESATTDPNGLLAVGGSLSVPRLLNAYRHGIFPWFEEGQPILWWSPTPRLVLEPDGIHVSRSTRKLLKRNELTTTFDQAFVSVIQACAAPRQGCSDTWITQSMILAYSQLHQAGHAHSVEVWKQNELVGGLYGVALGRMFFGESMFSLEPNASKCALAYLGRCLSGWGYELIDCQLETTHLRSMGAFTLPRSEFEAKLNLHCPQIPSDCAWQKAPDMDWHTA